jgi:hypothetical protein
MFNNYFVPNINKENNTDQIESALLKVKQAVPTTSKIYFLTRNDIQANPEIYYKVQFALVPRVVVAQKYEDVPRGSYMLQLRDKMNPNETSMGYSEKEFLLADGNEFFKATLLKKNL